MFMHIPESSANRLMWQATTMLRELPATMERLHGGELGWVSMPLSSRRKSNSCTARGSGPRMLTTSN